MEQHRLLKGEILPPDENPNALVHYIRVCATAGTDTQQELEDAMGALARTAQENGADVQIHSVPLDEAIIREEHDTALRNYEKELAAHFAILNKSLHLRQRQVLAHLIDGGSNQVIARRMHLAMCTVKRHLSELGDHLGGRSRYEILAKGLGFVSLIKLFTDLGIKLDTETPNGK